MRHTHDGASPSRETFDSMEWRVGQIYPVVPGKLYFTSHSTRAHTCEAIEGLPMLFFSSTLEPESYHGYCEDFGPTDLAGVVSFCRSIRTLLQDPRLRGRPVVYYTETDSETLSNAAFLLGAYLVLVEGMSPEDAAAPFSRIQPSPFKAFRDATHLASDFDLSILDCLHGLARGARAGFFDLETFDDGQFASDDSLGLSVMCPKFVAFKGPVSGRGCPSHFREPEAYLDRFQELGVSDVVRLNDSNKYDRQVFIEAGMRHHDMEFTDCTPPSPEIVLRLLAACSGSEGVIAVHCLAGLGRTGTLIALHLIVNHGWSARETIGWLRIVRPGSVIGEQQHFLVSFEAAQRRVERETNHPPGRTMRRHPMVSRADHPRRASLRQASVRRTSLRWRRASLPETVCVPSQITTASMSFGVPLPESESKFPSYPHYPHLAEMFPETNLSEMQARLAAVRALQVANGLAHRVEGARPFCRTG